MDPREIVRECPWSHAVDGDCAEYVSKYQMRAQYRGSWSTGHRCSRCSEWIAPAGVPATHDKLGRPIEAATRVLSVAEMRAQGKRCGCGGSDFYCPCQNTPDAETVAARIAAMEDA